MYLPTYPLWIWMCVCYVSVPVQVHISFLLCKLTICCSSCIRPRMYPHVSLSRSVCLSSLTVEGCCTGMWAVCIVCKNKPSGQRYSLRIYIKQLRKHSFWTWRGRVVMQQTTPWDSERKRKTDFTSSDSYIWLICQLETYIMFLYFNQFKLSYSAIMKFKHS